MTGINTDLSDLDQKSKPSQLLNLMVVAGLSQPQARVYLELVKMKESTASDLCKTTGVKDSRIYSILSGLEQMGLVMVQDSTPKRYMVTPLSEGLHNLQDRIDKDFTKSKDAIKELNLQLTSLFDSTVSIPSAMAFIIKGRKNILNKIRHEVLRVVKEILIRFPNPELYFEFEPNLVDLEKRGITVDVGLCHYSMEKLRKESKIPEMPLTICKKCCDCFYLIIDSNYLLSISNWNSTNVYAIWTSDTSLINITSFFTSSNIVD